MKGHIREHSPGHWSIVIEAKDSTGKRKRRWHSFKGIHTKREAQIERAKLITEAQNGNTVDPSRISVAEFLDRFERDWIGLATATIRHVHVVAHRAFKEGKAWGLLRDNPADMVKPPKMQAAEVKILQAAEAKELLGKLRCGPLYMLASLALGTGARRGELLALRWRDIDFRQPPTHDRASARTDCRARYPNQGAEDQAWTADHLATGSHRGGTPRAPRRPGGAEISPWHGARAGGRHDVGGRRRQAVVARHGEQAMGADHGC